MDDWLDRIDLILCRPEGALNVGATCRAMKTMGLKHLTLIPPQTDTLDSDEVQKMALHAREIYFEARICQSLDEALHNTVLSAGITRRRGSKRKNFSLLPEELAIKAASLQTGRIALVFGNEQSGLTASELACCNLACHIPANPEFPSLNLSHAVQIVTYAFWRQSISEKNARYTPIDRQHVDKLVRVFHDLLKQTGYFNSKDRFNTDLYFRDILARAALSKREATHIEKIICRIQHRNNSDNSQ